MRSYDEAYTSCLDLKFGDAVPDANLLSETQAIVCQCQHAMQIFTHLAPTQIAAAWKDALDKAAKGKGSAKMVQKEMFRAAWRDEYWDLAQQVRLRLLQSEADSISCLRDCKENIPITFIITMHGLQCLSSKPIRCPKKTAWVKV
jgi:hypothetical protein